VSKGDPNVQLRETYQPRASASAGTSARPPKARTATLFVDVRLVRAAVAFVLFLCTSFPASTQAFMAPATLALRDGAVRRASCRGGVQALRAEREDGATEEQIKEAYKTYNMLMAEILKSHCPGLIIMQN
jgi:hypothetical protein